LGSPVQEKPAAPSSVKLSAVPAELIKKLFSRIQEAVEMGDFKQINSIAGELKSRSKEMVPICDRLAQLAEDFDFDLGMPSVKYGRARFREIICKLLSEAPEYRDKPGHCENYLTRLSDERMPNEQLRLLPANNINLRILIVPGLLGECIADTVFPFETAMEHLRPRGYQIEPLIVSGRSSSDYNAKQIAKAVANLAVKEEDFLILIGHSKGANDILHFLINFPGLAHRIDAVVSVAGAINGSPIANQVANIYSNLAANLPFNDCEPGDGGAFRSLERPFRLTWMAKNPLPTSVKYYSSPF